MSEKSNLTEQIIKQEQKIKDLVNELDNWKVDVEEDTRREERKRTLLIEHHERELSNLKQRQDAKLADLESKLKTIDDSMKSIEEISKTVSSITN
jgi:hypothetical protein